MSGTIVTLTPNPSVDRTIAIPGTLQRGAVLRVESELSQPGGKGVNISRACVAAGVPTLAVLPVADDDPFVHDLDLLGVPSRPVRPAGPMRVNIAVTEPDGTTTKLNGPGATVGPDDLRAIADAVLTAPVESGSWVVLAGSQPPGAPTDWYADLVTALRTVGRRVALDTSDAALEAVVAGLSPASAPHLMKPNTEELASFTGADPDELEADPAAAARAAATLVDRGVETVLATLGGAGAVLVTAEGSWFAAAPRIEVVSTVGAGDSSLFGYLLAELRGAGPAERLASAVAHGSAAAGLPGTTVPTPDDVHPDHVVVDALDLGRAPSTLDPRST